jgi:thymidylate synthase (FAD)
MTYSPRSVETLTENITEEEIHASVNAILERRHFSVLRHVTYTFTVSGVSRALSHQLVRHTVGHSFEQRSQHYRTEKNPSFVLPGTIAEVPVALSLYQQALENSQEVYESLLECEVPKEDARFVLPNATETQLIWTANLEALLNFIQTRACRVNTAEIISVAIQVRSAVCSTFPEMIPYLGPTCFTRGMCFEGDKYYKVCNRPWKTPTVLWRPDFPKVMEMIGVNIKDGVQITEIKITKNSETKLEYSPNQESK